jgi:hypothetical protein
MQRFEGTRIIIPAPPLLHSNQTPVTVLPRLRAFLLRMEICRAKAKLRAVVTPRGVHRIAAINVTRNTTMKMKNKMRATPAAADATPPKPNTPATNATTAKMIAQ